MRWCGALGACLVVGLLAAPVSAQDTDPPVGEINVMRFTPAVGPGNYFQVEGAQTPGHVTGSAGLVLDYGHAPLALYNATCDPDGTNCTVTDTRSELVQYVAAGHITGSIALWDRLQINLTVPLVITRGDQFSYSTGRDMFTVPGGPDPSFTLADPRLGVKGHIWRDPDSGVALGASAFVTFPTGSAIAPNRFVGDALPTFGGHFIFEMVNSGFHLGANVGGIWRDETRVFSSVVGGQLTYGVAVGYDVTTLVGIFGELVGASTFTDQSDEHYLEWRLGGRFRVEDFEIHVAGGSGLPPFGLGTPLFRAIAGFQWAPRHADTDGDGIEDSQDNCPSEREDEDGWEDEDGCPEADNDDDGLLDADDPCPDQAEDVDQFEDEDGCPDTDNDGDGIHDGYDSCPDQAEDMDGDRDQDGCPDNDTDRDGIEDPQDQCVDEPEDFDGFGDEDGCPETDFDGDGLPDETDACPDQAEDMDEFEDEDGCPEEGGAPEGSEGRRRHTRGR
ncbi:MAG: thrombospondin type 3 repeat-containing protein [Sandaracinaceae bacterium]|nr:thrombospondin type 3 repeat-containing protein [Sandaracinaceae bacterium]